MNGFAAAAAALLLVMICINVLLRKRWLDGEHLSCPLVALPLVFKPARAAFEAVSPQMEDAARVSLLDEVSAAHRLTPDIPGRLPDRRSRGIGLGGTGDIDRRLSQRQLGLRQRAGISGYGWAGLGHGPCLWDG